MDTIIDIEHAIEKLPPEQVVELADWLEEFRLKRATPPRVEDWLQRARGVARPGHTTADIMALTRGDE